jgi:hypothetical protein
MGGHRPQKLLDDRDWLLARLAEKPDLTLHDLLTELRERGTVVSCDTLWRFLKKEDITFKNTLFAAEQDRPDVVRRRNRWKKYQGRIDPKRLVFIDETWAKTNMTRTRGWQACGKPLVAKVPHGHWKTMTFLAGCGTTGSRRRLCSTGRSMAPPSWRTSSRYSRRRSPLRQEPGQRFACPGGCDQQRSRARQTRWQR